MAKKDFEGSDYPYDASTAAAAIFAVIFGLSLLLHFGQIVRYKTWFMVIMLIALAEETLGYITRVMSIKQSGILWIVIVSQTCLITAPAFIAAQEYMLVGRIMAYVGGEYALIKHTRITKCFVGADIVAICTQAFGGSMLAGGNKTLAQLQTAKKVLLGGLALQVVAFGIFCFVAISYNIKTRGAPALKPYAIEMKKIRQLWIVFYITGVLITGRSIYRTAEFAQVSFTPGSDDLGGYAVTHEWPMYAFDSIPILITTLLLGIFHPGRFLPSQKGLRMDGTYEPQRSGFLCFGRRQRERNIDPETSDVSLRPLR